MNEEVRKRLELHRAMTVGRVEAEQERSAQLRGGDVSFDQWRSRVLTEVVDPAWAQAKATLREAGYIIDERPVMGLQQDERHMATSSPTSEKRPRSTTLGLDQKGYYVFRKNTGPDRRYLPPTTTVDGLVELIIDHSTADLEFGA